MGKLEEYRRKRRFDRTPEPPAFVPARPAGGPQSGTTAGRPTSATEGASADRPGKTPATAANRFVVQKHSARRLHYDFRLEIDGVLKSWAVPKGPSLNPGEKRLAVQTEDHPLEYAQFEGVIPEGSYGAGTVMVLDRGTFGVVNAADADQQLGRGELKFTLHGEKLRGGFVLVKLRHREKGNEWLLIKHRDAAADPEWNIGSHDGSVLTGRTLEEISESAPPKRAPQPIGAEELPGARRAAMPARLEPMLATGVAQAFSDPGWLYEIKWDGVRALAWLEQARVELRSRTGRVVTQQYPELAVLAECVRARRAILDGEIVVLDRHGRGDFERLAERMHIRLPSLKLLSSAPVTYYVFDLLYCDGYDLREAPLIARKELLRRLLDARDPLRYSDHHPEQGKELFELAREKDLEGIIAKRAASAYTSGRSRDWLKLKTRKELDAVICGWTAPRGSREHFGALLLGLYVGEKLRFIGHVGSGFDQRTQRAIG
jgi:bifunctional non-homologous end joining protein LigD